MSLFGKNIAHLDELFADELKNIYYMENEIVENLPDMIQAATAPDLKQALSAHLSETKGQVKRLEKCSSCTAWPPRAGHARRSTG